MSSSIEVRNPRTGAIEYEVYPPTEESLSRITTQLRRGQKGWATAGVEHRLDVLQEWKSVLQKNHRALSESLTTDTGRQAESQLEVELLVATIDRVCEMATAALTVDERKTASVPSVQIESQLVPYRLVGVISPWNFPLLLSGIDAVPALAAGCAVVIKPSEITPGVIEPLQATIEEVPALAEVLAVVPGGAQTGSNIVEQADAVAFTGSVETGKRIAAQAADDLTPVFLELGGKDPAIVLDSAEIDHATSAILWGSTTNNGHSCQAIERVYVHQNRYEEFVDRIIEKARGIELAYPTFESGDLGPIISEEQVETIRTHLSDARNKGGTVRCGGTIERHGGGHWLRPTVLTDVDHSMLVCREETFGPIIPIMPFQTEDEAVELANDTVYGLSAAVFAGTEKEAISVGRRIEAGAVSINDAALTAIIQEGEKQAFKHSGLGESRTGLRSIQRFVRQQSLLIQTEPTPNGWWYGTDE